MSFASIRILSANFVENVSLRSAKHFFSLQIFLEPNVHCESPRGNMLGRQEKQAQSDFIFLSKKNILAKALL